MTIYVERDEHGHIKGVYQQEQPGYAEEELDENTGEVQEFLNRF